MLMTRRRMQALWNPRSIIIVLWTTINRLTAEDDKLQNSMLWRSSDPHYA